MTVNVNSKFGK